LQEYEVCVQISSGSEIGEKKELLERKTGRKKAK